MTHVEVVFPNSVASWVWGGNGIHPFRLFNNGGTLQEPILAITRPNDRTLVLQHTSGITLADRCVGSNDLDALFDDHGRTMRAFDVTLPYP